MIKASLMKELKWGKNEENVESNIFLEVQRYYFVFELIHVSYKHLKTHREIPVR